MPSFPRSLPLPFVLTLVGAILCDAYPRIALADCESCQPVLRQVALQEEYRAKTSVILEKNKAYLAKLGKDDASKRIKVNSNILIATVQLETIANNIAALKKEMDKKGCQSCPLIKQ